MDDVGLNTEDIRHFLENTPANSVLFPRKEQLVTVSLEDSLGQAVKVLRDNNILAAPVLDNSGKAVRLFSVADAVDQILKTVSDEQLKSGKLVGLFQNKDQLAEQKLKDIGLVESDKKFQIRKDAPLLKVIDVILNHKAHRVLLVDNNEKPLALITQSELVRILSNILSEDVLQKTVQELNIGTVGVDTIHWSKTTLEAFKWMNEKKISALPVVNYLNKAEGHISLSDIKFLGDKFEKADHLTGPIAQYLEKAKQGEKKSQLYKCDKTTKLSAVMDTLQVHKVHRVYITNENDIPEGVIAHYDILKSIVGSQIQAAE